jgi:hypothetical protein
MDLTAEIDHDKRTSRLWAYLTGRWRRYHERGQCEREGVVDGCYVSWMFDVV